MDFATARTRYAELAHALDGTGGYAPAISWTTTDDGLRKPAGVTGACNLVPYPRESAEKFAARAACAVYENHLLQACARFTAYLGRRSPQRQGADGPLTQALIDDADDCGNHLDIFWRHFTLDVKARGAMLLLIDMPAERSDRSMADALGGAARVVPYLAAIAPENVADYTLDERGRFTQIGINAVEDIDGQSVAVVRRWDARGWAVYRGDVLLRGGPHPFGVCPVLPFTENGRAFPQLGGYAQIEALSRRLYNARSELDEILRSQTFSLLTLQIPPEVPNPAESAKSATATIGTHSLLVHQGDTPAFIAPDAGPAQTYGARIAELRETIARIGQELATETGTQAESGLARKLRFEALNADLATFARAMQDLEARMWALFHRALGLTSRVQVTWPDDYNISDPAAELDTLLAMQTTGFPEMALAEQRHAIASTLFDRAEPDTQAAIHAAIDEQAQAIPATAPAPITTP